jgi:hypothetical protein
MFTVPLNISRFSSQATLPAPDRGLRQILAEYVPDCKLSENLLRNVLDVIIFSEKTALIFLADMRISRQKCLRACHFSGEKRVRRRGSPTGEIEHHGLSVRRWIDPALFAAE